MGAALDEKHEGQVGDARVGVDAAVVGSAGEEVVVVVDVADFDTSLGIALHIFYEPNNDCMSVQKRAPPKFEPVVMQSLLAS